MIFYREVQYLMQTFSCQHRKQHISKRNYKISLLQEIHISKLELQRRPLKFVISFSKVYFWDLGLKFGSFLLGSCNPNVSLTDEFSVYIFPTMKS
jgi:hypothetical protein